MTEKEYMSLKAGDIIITSPKTGIERMVLEVHPIQNNQWIFLEQIPRPGKTTLFLKKDCPKWMLVRRGSEKDLPELYRDFLNGTLRVKRR